MSASEFYSQACKARGVRGGRPREYLVQTLSEIQAEMDDQRRPGVINLTGTVKPLFKARLTNGDLACFLEGLSHFPSGFQALQLNLSYNKVTAAGVASLADFLLGHRRHHSSNSNSNSGSLNSGSSSSSSSSGGGSSDSHSRTGNEEAKEQKEAKEETLEGKVVDNGDGADEKEQGGEERTVANLNLAHNDIGADGVASLVEILRSAPGLQSLVLSHNDIGASGAMEIVAALEGNRSLTHLDLAGTGFDSSVIITLCDMLRHRRNGTLKQLGLGSPYMSKRSIPCHTVMEHIGIMLKHNHNITMLNLTGHRIDDKGAEILCHYLETNKSVRALFLSKNNIGFKGAAAIAGWLVSESCALTKLDISRNNILDDGAVSLSEALKRNQTVQQLNLADNNIEDRGLLSLLQAAHNHPSLQQIELFNGNHFGGQSCTFAHEYPSRAEENGGIAVDFTTFVVDNEVQVAKTDL